MSKIGKLPVKIPSGVKVKLKDDSITITGPKGSLSQKLRSEINVKMEENSVIVTQTSDHRLNRSFHGLFRTLINNMVVGVTEGYTKTLELVGIGYRFEMNGKLLISHLGYSHPIVFRTPEEIVLELNKKGNVIKISGIDKQMVGAVTAKIRSFRPPEPFKGKGIKYSDETIRRKAGKAAATK